MPKRSLEKPETSEIGDSRRELPPNIVLVGDTVKIKDPASITESVWKELEDNLGISREGIKQLSNRTAIVRKVTFGSYPIVFAEIQSPEVEETELPIEVVEVVSRADIPHDVEGIRRELLALAKQIAPDVEKLIPAQKEIIKKSKHIEELERELAGLEEQLRAAPRSNSLKRLSLLRTNANLLASYLDDSEMFNLYREYRAKLRELLLRTPGSEEAVDKLIGK